MSSKNFKADIDVKNIYNTFVPDNQQFIIPIWQRPYSWTKQHWNDLWMDLQLSLKENTNHFIGQIIFYPMDLDNDFIQSQRPQQMTQFTWYTIIDGQQRITTLYLLGLAMFIRANKIAKDTGDKQITKHLFHMWNNDVFKSRRIKINIILIQNDTIFKKNRLRRGALIKLESL